MCSDNGPEAGAGSAGPFRGGKTMLYEGGVRSSLIVWGPGFIPSNKAGSENATSVFSALDVVPSLLALAGVKFTADIFDGENLADTLIGRATNSRRAPLCWRRPPDRPGEGEDLPDLAIREGRWKLLCEFDGSSPQLYDLETDAGETTNLAAQHPDRVRRLTEAVSHSPNPAGMRLIRKVCAGRQSNVAGANARFGSGTVRSDAFTGGDGGAAVGGFFLESGSGRARACARCMSRVWSFPR